ncbi:hypothetical protein CTI12_AA483670 [Artemisia annua]|uniref:Reverse transcriptase zinc-binding domain-containing protein n=1 Tax=Artemisia annua TaxID=35608 RepID=A0A2U1LEL1_ARTAN|nr:hypothetical protein CTI12_AA483670 [Artemisia annua]
MTIICTTVWVDGKNREVKFSMSRAWKDLRVNNQKVKWASTVWFSQGTLYHAFITWLAVNERLNTQDRLLGWNPNRQMQCAFCIKEADSHDHLFFSCEVTSKIWKELVAYNLTSLQKQTEELVFISRKQMANTLVLNPFAITSFCQLACEDVAASL